MSLRMKFKGGIAFLAASVLTLSLAACTGGQKAESTADGLTKVKIGLIPISAVAPVYVGIEQGFFKEEKIDLEPKMAASGSAITASIASGEQQFGFSANVSIFQANEKGLDMRIVAQGSQAGPGESSKFEAIVVRQDSPLKSLKDLEGKTVSVNALKTVGPTLIDAAMRKEGGDPTKVNMTEVGFGDANAAVKAGRVDAAYQTEPFITAGAKDGLRVLDYHYQDLAPSIWIAGYFTSGKYASQNPEVVSRFQAAMNKSLTYASEHPEAARKAITTYTEIDPALVDTMVLPGWDTNLDPASPASQVMIDATVADGLIKQAPDPAKTWIQPAAK
ncbi:ABC transporter substrate-binding protein [Raineyella sp. LH-20]|uniref:ABC transporter substrate-binding protein n=1 Tax=Raineyella sp. LH-20 TaxID=3081204 RepID=UPI002953E10A|nr:ABC transporter substrate-binding protein [Raineyella sp. LH-20]WOP19382.1 ABC transporter substrate-binding protein [Raineyella sp. LH-20]